LHEHMMAASYLSCRTDECKLICLASSLCNPVGCAEMLAHVQRSPRVTPQQRYTARTSSGRVRTCAKCNQPFTALGWPAGHPQQGQIFVAGVEIDGVLYHPECVACKGCGKPITAENVRDKDGLYHERCYKKKLMITCDCCHERIRGQVWLCCSATMLIILLLYIPSIIFLLHGSPKFLKVLPVYVSMHVVILQFGSLRRFKVCVCVPYCQLQLALVLTQ
jgi:hypothetical protein